MRVILLCAGYATRLYPLTQDRPKPLLAVGDKPILEWILESLRNVEGIQVLHVVTNHKFAGAFEKWVKRAHVRWPVEVVDDQTTANENRLGAIGDLKFVLETRKVGAEDLLVIAGDNFFDFDLSVFVKTAGGKRPNAVVALYDLKDRNRAKEFGVVQLDPEGRVTAFLEKPSEPPASLISCGLYWFPGEVRVLLDKYLAGGHNSDQPGHYMSWLAGERRLFGVVLEGLWLDIGDPASYEKANAMFSKS